MKKILAVALMSVAALGAIAMPAAITKADVVNPILDATADLTPGSYSVLPMRLTAYASVPDETDSTPFQTANGTTVHDGIVASNMLPFGTKIEIPALFGTKVFTVEDRMSSKFYRTIDIWMPSVSKALVFGLKYQNIIVLGTSTYAKSPFETTDLSMNLR